MNLFSIDRLAELDSSFALSIANHNRLKKRSVITPPIPSDVTYGDYIKAFRAKVGKGLAEGGDDEYDEEPSLAAASAPTGVAAPMNLPSKAKSVPQKRSRIEYVDSHGNIHFQASNNGGREEEREKAEEGQGKVGSMKRRSNLDFDQDERGNHLHVETSLKSESEKAEEKESSRMQVEQEKDTLPQRRDNSSLNYSHTKDGVMFTAVSHPPLREKGNKEPGIQPEEEEEESMERRNEAMDSIDYNHKGNTVSFGSHYNFNGVEEKGADDGEEYTPQRRDDAKKSLKYDQQKDESVQLQAESHTKQSSHHAESGQKIDKEESASGDTKNFLKYDEHKDGSMHLEAQSSTQHPKPAPIKVSMNAQVSSDGGKVTISVKPNEDSHHQPDSAVKESNRFTPDR